MWTFPRRSEIGILDTYISSLEDEKMRHSSKVSALASVPFANTSACDSTYQYPIHLKSIRLGSDQKNFLLRC